MNVRSQIEQNLLLRSAKISSKNELSSYYSRNKQKLPPILQSKNLFLEHLISCEKETNQLSQRNKTKSLESEILLTNNIFLRRKPETYRSIQHPSNFTKSIISIQPKAAVKNEDNCPNQEQKGLKTKKNIYLSATKLNLQLACRSSRSSPKKKQPNQIFHPKLKELMPQVSKRNKLQNRLQIQKVALRSRIGFLGEDCVPKKVEDAIKPSPTKKEEHLMLRKHLKTCINDQEYKYNCQNRKVIEQFFAKKEKSEFGNKSVTEFVSNQSKIRQKQLTSLDQQNQSFFLEEKVQPWSYNSPHQAEMIGSLMNN